MRNMIDHARVGACMGELSRVKIDVDCRDDCHVKDFIVNPQLIKLRPGQHVTSLVKIVVPPIPKKDSEDSVTSDELYEQICQMLGESMTELFTTKVVYQHSLFSKGTHLTTQNTCSLRRSDKRSPWSRPTSSPSSQHKVDYGRAVFVARNWPPHIALEHLHRKFGSAYFEPGHASCIHQIREELEFQVDVGQSWERLKTQQRPPQEVSFGDRQQYQPANQTPSSLHISTSETDTATDTQTVTVSQLTTAEESVSPPPETTAVDDLKPLEQDAARKIWQSMRRNSRTVSSILAVDGHDPHSLHMSTGPEISLEQLEAEDKQLREIRREALRNKRSVGADTLRDFRWEGIRERFERGGRSMPWM